MGAWWAAVYGVAQVRHDWRDLAAAATLSQWRRQWQPTPVLLPGKSHGRRNLVGCSPWGRYELDTTERLHFHFSLSCIGEGNGNPLHCSWPGKSQGQGSLVGCRLWGHTESDRLKQFSSSSSSSNTITEGFPGGASDKEPNCQYKRHERWKFDPWVRKIPRGGHGNPLQYSCLENPMYRGAWQATVHGIAKGYNGIDIAPTQHYHRKKNKFAENK